MIGPCYDDQFVTGADMKGSYKTTLAGLGAILVAAGSLVQAIFDGDPSTVPNYEATIAAVIAGVGLLFARDNNVSSEVAGAK
jgi:hypothetical protein